MADRHGSSRDDEQVSEPVLEWLDEIAEAEGVSREAAVEYLISSYWRLEEIVDLLEAGEGPLNTDPAEESARLDGTDLDSLHDRFDSLLEDLRARDEAADQRDELLSSIVDLGDRIERLEGRLPDESTPEATQAQAADLDDQLATLEARLESLESEVSDVEGRVDTLADGAVTAETFAAVTEQTRSFQDSITRQHDSLRGRVQTEFEHIRTILTHLLDTAATNKHRSERVIDDFEETFRAHLARRETLEAIVLTANRRGVSQATCEHCGETVRLAMLQSPACPSCEHEFSDIETSTGFLGFRRSHVLTVDADETAR